jgi:hypothetical protein
MSDGTIQAVQTPKIEYLYADQIDDRISDLN